MCQFITLSIITEESVKSYDAFQNFYFLTYLDDFFSTKNHFSREKWFGIMRKVGNVM